MWCGWCAAFVSAGRISGLETGAVHPMGAAGPMQCMLTRTGLQEAATAQHASRAPTHTSNLQPVLPCPAHACGHTHPLPPSASCVTVLDDDSYAANGIKHCVRPTDMAGKSAALILRRIQPAAMRRAHVRRGEGGYD